MLKNKIEKDYHLSQRKDEREKIGVLRMLLASLHNKEIEFRPSNKKLEDKDVLDVIRAEVKKRKEAIFLFKKGGREDLAKKEEQALEILQSYLPKELKDEEIKEIIKSKISELNAQGLSDFGKVMGAVMKEISGRAEGEKVAKIVKEILGADK